MEVLYDTTFFLFKVYLIISPVYQRNNRDKHITVAAAISAANWHAHFNPAVEWRSKSTITSPQWNGAIIVLCASDKREYCSSWFQINIVILEMISEY